MTPALLLSSSFSLEVLSSMDFSKFSLSSFSMFNLPSAGLICLLPAFLLLLSRRLNSKQPKLPPGPPCWPVVGNLLQLACSGKQFFQYIRDLEPKYGPIFTLKLGNQTTIMVTCPKLAHEALIKNGKIFADRPADLPNRAILSSNKFTVNTAVYGPTWRCLRRNMVQGALNSTRVKDFRDVRNSALDRLMDRLQSEARLTHGVVPVLKNARFAVFCILLSMCFGLEMGDETVEKIDETLKNVLIASVPRLDDYVPMLAPFFRKQKKRIMEVGHEHIRTLLPFIKKRKSILQNPGAEKTCAFAYVDTLFDLKIEGRVSTPTDAELVTLCAEFINAGTDTTATVIEWAMARLVQMPKIQSRLFNEIISTVGNRKIDEGDLDNMPYLDAFTKELLRKHPPGFFLLTHAVTQPTLLAGYDIPVEARINFYLPSMAEDPTLWPNPKEFDPDRFTSGAESADMTGVTGAKMIPFGAGRRICPGLDIAIVHIKLMVARMVQEFEWSAPSSQGAIDFTETFLFTLVMKTPFQAVIRPRKLEWDLC